MIRVRTLLLLVASIGLAVAQVPKLEEARALKGHASAAAVAAAYEAALPAVRTAGDRGVLAHAVLEAGQSALAAGEYARAFDRGREAEGLFHELKDVGNEAASANVTGSADLYRGAYAAAIGDFERALRLDRAQKDAKGEITRLSNIGNVYFFQGQYAAALSSYEAAMARVNATQGEAWNASRRQLVLTNLATLYEQLGQYEKARGYYDEALARGASMPASEYGQLLANAGTMYRRLGDPVKALESYAAAQALFAREHLSVAEIHVLQNFGIAQALDFNDLPRAVEAFTRALKLAESPLNKRESVLAHLFRGEAFYRMGRTKEARDDFADALTGAREIGAREEQWTALYGIGRIERSLGTFCEAIGIIESVRSGLGSSSLKAEFLANKRDVYDAAIALMLESGERRADALLPMFEQARSRNLQDAVRGTAGPPELRWIQAQLTAGAVLIEYWMGDGEIAAVWTGRDRSGVMSGKLSAEEVASIRGFRSMLRDAHDAAWRVAAERVGELLLGGVPLEGVAHLLIVPDGVLNTIPFEVLGTPMAMERFPVSYLPTAALLLRKTEQRSPAPPWRRQLLASDST